MKKYWIWILVIELQVIVVLVALFTFRLDKEKAANRIQSQRIIELEEMIYDSKLTEIKSSDLIIGDKNAPISMIMYTRFDCPICQEFFDENYLIIKKEFIETGKVKLVLRNLVHQSKEKNLMLTTQINQIYHSNEIEVVNKTLMIDSILVNESLTINSLKLDESTANLQKRLLAEARSFRSYGIKNTPTFFINGTKLIGNRSIDRFRTLINNSL